MLISSFKDDERPASGSSFYSQKSDHENLNHFSASNEQSPDHAKPHPSTTDQEHYSIPKFSTFPHYNDFYSNHISALEKINSNHSTSAIASSSKNPIIPPDDQIDDLLTKTPHVTFRIDNPNLSFNDDSASEYHPPSSENIDDDSLDNISDDASQSTDNAPASEHQQNPHENLTASQWHTRMDSVLREAGSPTCSCGQSFIHWHFPRILISIITD